MADLTIVGLTSVAKRKQAQRMAGAARQLPRPAADLKKEIATLKQELARALERQTATSEVLHVKAQLRQLPVPQT